MVGLLKTELTQFIEQQDIDLSDFLIEVNERYYETSVSIEAPISEHEGFDELIRLIMITYNSFVYGTNEKNVYSAAFEMLKYKKLRLAIVESVSAGRLSSEFVAHNEGASEVLIEGLVCYTVESKSKRLGIPITFFDEFSPQSVECSYEMASMLLASGGADIVIATSGYATDDIEDNNNGKNYIAVGDNSIIHVYKHKFIGTRNNIMQQVSKNAFLHLIKKLKSGGFDYSDEIL